MKINIKEFDAQIYDNTFTVQKECFKTNYQARIYDFHQFALEDKGYKFFKIALGSSLYGSYHYLYYGMNGLYLTLCSLSSVFFTFVTL